MNVSAERLPPNAMEAEQAILGCILLNPADCIPTAREDLGDGEAFYDLRHRVIYRNVLATHHNGIPVDVIALQQALKDTGELDQIGGIAYLMALTDTVPSSANLSFYLDIVMAKFIKRQILATCVRVGDRVYNGSDYNDLISEIERDLCRISKFTEPKSTRDGEALSSRMIDDLEYRFQNKGKFNGVETGFSRLDAMTWGLQFGEQAVIGARPSIGKTAIAINILDKACLHNRIPTLFITCEMSTEALSRRLLSCHSNVRMTDIRRGDFTQEDFQRLTIFRDDYRKAPVFITDGTGGITSSEVCAEIARHARQNGVRLVILDYLQKVRAVEKHEKRTYEIASVSSALRAVAIQNKVALVTLAQLNREPDRDKGRMPRLSDLGDSGAIERDADLVILLHRDKSDQSGQSVLVVAKQRDGETGALPLTFNGQYCRFENNHNND